MKFQQNKSLKLTKKVEDPSAIDQDVLRLRLMDLLIPYLTGEAQAPRASSLRRGLTASELFEEVTENPLMPYQQPQAFNPAAGRQPAWAQPQLGRQQESLFLSPNSGVVRDLLSRLPELENVHSSLTCQLLNNLISENLLELIPRIIDPPGTSFRPTLYQLFNLCRSLPAEVHSQQVGHFVRKVLDSYPTDLADHKEAFLRDFGHLFLFLKQYSNDVCFDQFEQYFGPGRMLGVYLEHEPRAERILFDFIHSRKYDLAKAVALAIKAAPRTSKEGDKDDLLRTWAQTLCIRQISGTATGQNYQDEKEYSNRGHSDDSDASNHSDADEARVERFKNNQILPMFAALEHSRLELAIALSVTEDICPDEYLKEGLYSLTVEEIAIIKRLIDVKDLTRASFSGLTAFDFKDTSKSGKSEAKEIITRFTQQFSPDGGQEDPRKDCTNAIKLLLVFPALLPFIRASPAAYRIFEQVEMSSISLQAVQVFCITLFLKYDLFGIKADRSRVGAKQFVGKFVLNFFERWDNLTILYALKKVYGIDCCQQDLHIGLDQQYMMFQEYESQYLSSWRPSARLTDLYQCLDRKQLVRTLFRGHFQPKSRRVDQRGEPHPSGQIEEAKAREVQRIGKTCSDYAFYSTLMVHLNITAEALEEYNCYMPIFDTAAEMVQFYDVEFEYLQVKEYLLSLSERIVRHIDALLVEASEQPNSLANKDLNKDMQHNAQAKADREELPADVHLNLFKGGSAAASKEEAKQSKEASEHCLSQESLHYNEAVRLEFVRAAYLLV